MSFAQENGMESYQHFFSKGLVFKDFGHSRGPIPIRNWLFLIKVINDPFKLHQLPA